MGRDKGGRQNLINIITLGSGTRCSLKLLPNFTLWTLSFSNNLYSRANARLATKLELTRRATNRQTKSPENWTDLSKVRGGNGVQLLELIQLP